MRVIGRRRRLRALALAVVAGAATMVVVGRLGPALHPTRVAGGVAPIPVPRAADQLSAPDPSPALIEGPARPGDLELPQERAGTARTWYAHDRWWAVLPDPATGAHHIWTLSGPDGPWVDTTTLVDERPFAQVEVTWTGRDLVITATGTRPYRSHALRLSRFSWSPSDSVWVREEDDPLTLTEEGAPGTLTAVTAAGEVWLARPQGRGVIVAHTEGRTPRVGAWSSTPVPATADDVGGFALSAAGDEVHIVWRSRSADHIGVATQSGGTWTARTWPVPRVAGEGPVEVEADPGGRSLLVLLPILTAVGSGRDQDPAVVLVSVPAGDRDGGARVSVVSRSLDDLRTPALLVDETRVRVVAVAPASEIEAEEAVARGGRPTASLVEKSVPRHDLAFAPGRGRVLIPGIDGVDPSRPLVPSGPSGPEAGHLLIVSGREAQRWVTWTDGTPRPTEPPPVRDGRTPTALVNDTFDSLTVGSPPPAAWYPDGDGALAAVVGGDDGAGRALPVGHRAPDDPAPITACRAVPVVAADTVTVEGVVRTIGRGDGDTKVLTVRGTTGSLASIRRSEQGLIGWSTPGGRATSTPVADDATLRVIVGLDLRRRTADITIRSLDGAPVAQVRGLPWLSPGPAAVDEVCVAPAPGTGTEVRVHSLLVTAT